MWCQKLNVQTFRAVSGSHVRIMVWVVQHYTDTVSTLFQAYSTSTDIIMENKYKVTSCIGHKIPYKGCITGKNVFHVPLHLAPYKLILKNVSTVKECYKLTVLS